MNWRRRLTREGNLTRASQLWQETLRNSRHGTQRLPIAFRVKGRNWRLWKRTLQRLRPRSRLRRRRGTSIKKLWHDKASRSRTLTACRRRESGWSKAGKQRQRDSKKAEEGSPRRNPRRRTSLTSWSDSLKGTTLSVTRSHSSLRQVK